MDRALLQLAPMSPAELQVLPVHTNDTEGDAVVDCPRGRIAAAELCERCADCVHLSRPSRIEDWIVVCLAPPSSRSSSLADLQS